MDVFQHRDHFPFAVCSPFTSAGAGVDHSQGCYTKKSNYPGENPNIKLLFRVWLSDCYSQWENFLYQSSPERPFPARKPSRFSTSSPLELNLIIALTSLYIFHLITGLVRNSVMFPFPCKYLNTCTISLLLSSISRFFLTFLCTRYMPQRDQDRTRVNDGLLKEEWEIFLWLLLRFSVHGFTLLSLLLMTNSILHCKALVWHCWPNFDQCCAAEAPSLTGEKPFPVDVGWV